MQPPQSIDRQISNILIDEDDLKLDDSADKEGIEIASEICDTDSNLSCMVTKMLT